MVQRREFLTLSLSALLAPSLIFPSVASAQTLKFSPDLVMQNLEKAIWLSTNSKASRAAYVIAAPWCVHTQRFYQEQRQMNHDIDFRFIYFSLQKYDRAIANAYLSTETDQVSVFYTDPGARLPRQYRGPAKWIESINFTSVQNMMTPLRSLIIKQGEGSRSPTGLSVPTVVQLNQEGKIVAVSGATPYLASIVQSLNQKNGTASPLSDYRDFIQNARHPRSARHRYFARLKTVDCYAAPLPGAPLIKRIEKGYGLKGSAERINGQDWVALRAFQKQDHRVWARATDLVKK